MTEMDREIIDHMIEPKNYGTMDDPDAVGIGENPENGEKVIVYLKVGESEDGSHNPIIDDIKFQAIGCMTTVVAGSIITSEAKGIDFAMGDDLIAVTLGMLDGVDPEEAACSEMVALALKASMDTYRAKKDDPEIPAIIYKIENSCAPRDLPAENSGAKA